jgi:hypothetical protein
MRSSNGKIRASSTRAPLDPEAKLEGGCQQAFELINRQRRKCDEWTARRGKLHMKKGNAYKSLRAALQTVRNGLPVEIDPVGRTDIQSLFPALASAA